jgi:dihydrofolate reductase/thymidylate synthase
MESPLLSAIHLTLVEGEGAESAACDTFMPPIDEARFRVWSASSPRNEGAFRYSFLCYTRAGQEGLPALPPALASRHEEQQVRRQQGPAGTAGS